MPGWSTSPSSCRTTRALIHRSPKSVFENIPVQIPNKDTQRKIAAILSAYDDLIANNQRRIALLEGMTEEIYCE